MVFRLLNIVSVMLLLSATLIAQSDKLGYALAYERGGDLKNAARIYIELFESNPRNSDAFDGVVRTLGGLNQHASLLPLIEKRFAVAPERSTALLAGAVSFKANKPDDAEQWWTKFIDMSGNTSEAWAELGGQQAELLLSEKAVTSFRKAREKSNAKHDYADQLEKLYSTLGRTGEAALEVLNIHERERELAMTYGRMSALMTSDTAKHIVGDVIMNAKDVPDLLNIKQWYYRHTRQWDKALEITGEIEKSTNARGMEMLRFADAARAEDAFDVAIRAYEIVLKDKDDKRLALSAAYGIASALDQKLRTKSTIEKSEANEVIDKYRAIMNSYPDHPLSADAMYHAAVLTDEVLGNSNEAREWLRMLLNKWRGTSASYDGAIALADIYISIDQIDEAKSALMYVESEKNAQFLDKRDIARLKRADLLLYTGKLDSARVIYTQLAAVPGSVAANDALDRMSLLMLSQDDSAGVAHYFEGRNALAHRNTEQAARIFVRTANSSKDDEVKDRSRIEAAKCFIKLDNVLAADTQLVAVIDRIPETSRGDEALVLAADLLEKRGDVQGAITALTSLLVQYPRSILAPSARERIRKLRGDA